MNFILQRSMTISTSCVHNLVQTLRMILGELKKYLYKSLPISKVTV